jgi:hypothetical protein
VFRWRRRGRQCAEIDPLLPVDTRRGGCRLGRGYAAQNAEENDVCEEIWVAAFSPGGSGGRGDPGGEVCGVKVLWSSGNSSPKFLSAVARCSRGCLRRSGAQVKAKPFQGDVPEHGKEDGIGERLRERWCLRKSAPAIGGVCEIARWFVSSLMVILLGFRKGEVHGREGSL